jgi:hypothetical protein
MTEFLSQISITGQTEYQEKVFPLCVTQEDFLQWISTHQPKLLRVGIMPQGFIISFNLVDQT